jgi:excisionase family DNA binding protein
MKRHSTVFLTVREIADATHLSESTIWRLLANKNIPSVKIGGSRRVPKSWLAEKVGAGR